MQTIKSGTVAETLSVCFVLICHHEDEDCGENVLNIISLT
jgi:hypothetical protein